MIPKDRFNKYQHYLSEFHLFSINPVVALNYHSFLCKSNKVLFLCTNRLESFSATKIVSGVYKTTTKMKGLTLAFRLCPFAHDSPLSHRALSHGGLDAARRPGVCAFWRAGAGAAARSSPGRNASAAAEVAGGPLIPRKRGGQSGPAGLWWGGAGRAWRSGRGLGKSRPSGFSAAFAALSAAPCRARDAASGFGQPAGGRTAARRAEGGAVGGHRSARPQGGRLAGGLLQRLVGACRPWEYGAARHRAASPASRASAGGPSEGWRIQERVGIGGCSRNPEPPLSDSSPRACGWL